VHEFLLEAARLAGVDFIVNVTLDRDKNITGIFSGGLEAAHLAGAAFCGKHSRVELPAEADVVVTSNGGFRLIRICIRPLRHGERSSAVKQGVP